MEWWFMLFWFTLFWFTLFLFTFWLMLFWFMLFWFRLFWFTLFWFMLFWFMLFWFTLFWFMLFGLHSWFMLFWFTLFWFTLFWFMLFGLHSWFMLFWFTLFCSVLLDCLTLCLQVSSLLIIFANSLDPDQTRQNVGLIWIQTVWWYSDGINSWKIFFRKKMILKKSADDNKHVKLPCMQRVKAEGWSLTLCLLGIFSCFCYRNILSRIPWECHANSLDPDQDRHFVRPDLDPNCLQRISADDKSRR